MNSITLSIIVLSYNNGVYIEDCLKSIEEQGIDSYEVIIIDDSSKDDSVSVIEEYIKNKPQFTLIQKPNSGGAISSQIGIRKARGKYIALVDSDDLVAKGAYIKLIRRLETDGSDFAAGLPMRMLNGFMFANLANGNERNIFASDRVLTTSEERAEFSYQVFYWNAVYRTDFIRENEIEMPSHLMIADRVFIYKALMRAKKISILTDVVYYWRRKGNNDNMSLVDQQVNFKMIADRINSFEAQLLLCLEEIDFDIDINKQIWERSFSRMYYPLYEMAKSEDEENPYPDFVEACDRYRMFLVQYQACFVHLIANSDLKTPIKFITEKILTKQYKHLFDFLSKKKALYDFTPQQLGKYVYNSLLRENRLISVRQLLIENDGVFLQFQVNKDALIEKLLSIKKVYAINRYFSETRFELEVDQSNLTVDLSILPDSTYVLEIICEHKGDMMRYVPSEGRDFGLMLSCDLRNRVYTYSSKASILTIQRKNLFTLIAGNEDNCYLGVNVQNYVEEVFFYNTEDNERYYLDFNNGLYNIKMSSLPKGKNHLMYKNVYGLYVIIRKKECSNGILDSSLLEKLFYRGKIMIEV